jgi:hypothetical protein
VDAQRAPEPRLPLELLAVWSLHAVVALEIFATYWRLPAAELYHVSGSGPTGGAGRVLVFLNFPTALVAIAVLVLLADRLASRATTAVAAVGVGLCAVVFWPGVVDQADLDARHVNKLAGAGVLLAVMLTLVAARRLAPPARPSGERGDLFRLGIAVVALALAVPWIAADLGLSFNGVPVLGTLWQSGELRAQPGVAGLHVAVHHGHHHGMDGVLLVLSALLLSRLLGTAHRRTRTAVGAYLALMVAYGTLQIANDFWTEQVVKRGWTSWQIPDTLEPTVSVGWGVIVLGALAIYALGARSGRRSEGVATPGLHFTQ